MANATVERAFYSPTEAAQALGVSLSSVWVAIRTREIGSIRLGGRRLIPVSEIERLRAAALAPASRPGHGRTRQAVPA